MKYMTLYLQIESENMMTSKNYYDDIMSLNYDTIVIFSIYGRFGVMWKPDFRCMVHLSKNFINNEKKKQKQN